MTARHGGNLRELAIQAGTSPDAILDFSANINPLGPPDWLRPVVSRALSNVVHYPDPESASLVQAIAAKHAVQAATVLVGNGSSEILSVLPRALGAVRAVIPVPSYSEYARSARLAGLEIREIRLPESNGFALDLGLLAEQLRGGDLVFLGQPNNPTGRLLDVPALRRLAAERPSATFAIDEAFVDFVEGVPSLLPLVPPNVVVIRSLTKLFAVPGLRIGYMVAAPELVNKARELLTPWSVNSLAQAVGEQALRDESYVQRTREAVTRQRAALLASLASIPGLHTYPGEANFLLLRLERPGLDAAELARRLLRRGLAIRVCDNFAGLDGRFFRVAVRSGRENERLCVALAEVLGPEPAPSAPRTPPLTRRKTPAIMFQGASSNAGKSVLTAALCRILLQDGYRVAPFKAQNMSLNSFVTREGGEMGRAQVVQAQACRLDPEVRMNPVLLKPCTDTGAQVIVMGKPVGNMKVGEYTRYKPEAFEAVKAAYDSLAQEYDAIVLEGAGSPGEVNLKHADIVNMRMAQHAEAPVLIVGDIDRGGVYASFVGTMEVLAEWERSMVAGFVVNRFRGDQSLLAPAHDCVLRHTGRPVLGVVPYLKHLGLPEEDSVEFKSGALDDTGPKQDAVEVAVVDLPHISNFTDFDAFRFEPDVRLRIVRSAAELGQPDALILPGSKNVIGDIEYLRRSGLADRIAGLAQGGLTEIVGVCAGLQILGQTIADPHQIESLAGKTQGLGLLPVTTVLAQEKTLTRTAGKHLPSGLPVFGYEIHHGQTEMGNCPSALVAEEGRPVGVAAPNGRIWGTYLHGVFDADGFRRWFIDRLRERRGMPPLGKPVATYDLEPALDRLAEVVRQSLDMDRIRKLVFGD
jgi:cobyric acid synthase CobQ/L-threonine-O-3-phosphate decarboxylase